MRNRSRRVAATRIAEYGFEYGLGAPGDRALLERMRAGDDAAFGALYRRHSAAVRAFAATQVTGAADADDLTAEAFFRVLQTVRNGAGPETYARAYLITVAKRVAVEWAARSRDVPVSDDELDGYREPRPDGVNRRIERSLIVTAFRSLPERWRAVLWRVEVEGQRPASVAGSFGLSEDATAALARRARDGLRAAYLQAHLSTDPDADGLCRTVTEKLGAYASGGLRGSESRRVRAHLAGCPSCRSLAGELTDVCAGLRAVSGRIVLPAAGLAALRLLPAGAPQGTAAVGAKAVGTKAVGAKLGGLAAFGARTKLGLAAASAGAVSALGLGAGTLLEAPPSPPQQLSSEHRDVIAFAPDQPSSSPTGVPGMSSVPRLTGTAPVTGADADDPARPGGGWPRSGAVGVPGGTGARPGAGGSVPGTELSSTYVDPHGTAPVTTSGRPVLSSEPGTPSGTPCEPPSSPPSSSPPPSSPSSSVPDSSTPDSSTPGVHTPHIHGRNAPAQ